MEQEADLLIELLDRWKIQQPILFGHSDGGSIALIAGGKYPERIKGVITEGAHIFVEEVTIAGIKAAIELYNSTDLRQKLERYHGAKADAMFWAWASTWCTNEFRSWNIEHFLPTLKCPSLIIQGEQDEYGTLDQVNRIVLGIGGPSTPLIIPEGKHSPHKEVPDLIIEQSSKFILELG